MKSGEPKWRDVARRVRVRLEEADVDDAGREARWIVEAASGFGLADWFEARDQVAPSLPASRALELAERRAAGEPLQYVIGSWPFRRVDLMVDDRVLIPRPETERVVDVALAEAHHQGIRARRRRAAVEPPGPRAVLVDLGTGSGAIAISLAAELSGVEVWATDASRDALVVARANAAGNAVGTVRFAEGDWFEALDPTLRGRCSLVVSNPPYVSEAEWGRLAPEVADYEPRDALVAGPRGTEASERILGQVGQWLRPGGAVVLEIAPHQGSVLTGSALGAGLVDVAVETDLSGRDRVLVARRRA